MEKKKFDALLQKTMRALMRTNVSDGNLKRELKFIKRSHKIQEKLAKKIGDDSYFFMGELCLILARKYPEAKETYSSQSCNFLESAYKFNDGDSRAITSLQKNFNLLDLPDADGKPFYFYFKRPQLVCGPSEPFEFEGKVYREIYSLDTIHHNSDYYVTCTTSSDGKMTYQLVTDYAERDALHKRKWST